MRIAISTGGGDAPGLNAVIRAVVLSAHYRGWRSYGIQRGYEGLLSFNGVVPLGPAQVRGITHLGVTILGTTNRGNPFRYVMRDAEGTLRRLDCALQWVVRKCGCDSAPRDPFRHREGLRQNPEPRGRWSPFQH